jgi:hypothetical protein
MLYFTSDVKILCNFGVIGIENRTKENRKCYKQINTFDSGRNYDFISGESGRGQKSRIGIGLIYNKLIVRSTIPDGKKIQETCQRNITTGHT